MNRRENMRVHLRIKSGSSDGIVSFVLLFLCLSFATGCQGKSGGNEKYGKIEPTFAPVNKIPYEIQLAGRRKLRMINNSQNLIDLKIPPSNRLEKLSGNYKDFYSIRINNKWRIIFIWRNNNSEKVTIIDYH